MNYGWKIVMRKMEMGVLNLISHIFINFHLEYPKNFLYHPRGW